MLPAALEPVLPKLLARILPFLPDALTLHDPDGRYRLATPFIRQVTGWSPSELLGRSPYEFIHPEDLEMVQRRYHEAANAGACVRGRYRFRHRLGHHIWLEFVAAPIYDDPRDPRRLTGHVALARDVSAEVQAVARVREQASHLELMQDLAGLAWWTLELRSGALRHNEGFVELTGHAASTVGHGSAWRRLIHPADRGDVLTLWRRLRRTPWGAAQTAELRLLRPGGGWRWVRMTMGLQPEGSERAGRDGPARGLLLHGVMLDIDEAVRSRERTTRWMREQERQHAVERVNMAHQLHDEVGQILSSLRWQMESVAQALARDPTAAASAGLPQTLQAWMAHLDEANQTLRRVARRLRPALPSLGLLAALQRLIEEFQTTWLQRVAVHTELPDALPDGPQWRVQLILGIVRESLNNIARHAQARNVWLQAQTLDGRRVALLVRDDGRGMDLPTAAAHQRLGLASLHERARQLDASLSIHSEPGAGTLVTLLVAPGEPHAVEDGQSPFLDDRP